MTQTHVSHHERRTFWRRHVQAWRQSGLSQAKYAEQENFTPYKLRYWIKQFPELKSGRHEKKPTAPDTSQDSGFRLVPVNPPSEEPAPGISRQEAPGSPAGVTLTRERVTVQLSGPLDRESLALLLEQLGGA